MKALSILIVISVFSCQQVKREYYNSGKMKEEYGVYGFRPFYVKINGTYKSYYENGQLKEEGYYENSKKTGMFKYFYEDGKLLNLAMYKNDTAIHIAAYNKKSLLVRDYLYKSKTEIFKYYKNKKIYSVQYFKNLYKDGEKNPYAMLEDSCIIYSYSDSSSKNKKMLKIINIRDNKYNYKKSLLFSYSLNGKISKTDTIVKGREVEQMIRKIMGKDTLEIL